MGEVCLICLEEEPTVSPPCKNTERRLFHEECLTRALWQPPRPPRFLCPHCNLALDPVATAQYLRDKVEAIPPEEEERTEQKARACTRGMLQDWPPLWGAEAEFWTRNSYLLMLQGRLMSVDEADSALRCIIEETLLAITPGTQALADTPGTQALADHAAAGLEEDHAMPSDHAPQHVRAVPDHEPQHSRAAAVAPIVAAAAVAASQRWRWLQHGEAGDGQYRIVVVCEDQVEIGLVLKRAAFLGGMGEIIVDGYAAKGYRRRMGALRSNAAATT